MSSPTLLKVLAPLAGAAAVLLAPVAIAGHARSTLAIAVAMILAWMVESLHPAIVGFVGAFLFRATGDVEFETAFGGFGTPTPWFLYAALMLLNAADESGFGARLGAISPSVLTRSIWAASLTLVALAYALAFVLPSTLARATILALAASAWSWHRPSTRTLLLLVAAYAAVALGHAEMPGGATAIRGFDTGVAIALLAGVSFLSRTFGAGEHATTVQPTPGAFDRKVAVLIAIVIGLWITTRWHRGSPELVGLAAGLVTVLPGMTRARGRHARPTADPLAIILAGTALSIPAVLLETKAAEVLMHYWAALTQSRAPLPQDLVAYWTTTAYRMFSPDAARPSLLALDGIAGPLGTAAAWAYAGSTLLSVHQSPALVLAVSLGGVRAWQVFTLGLLVLLAGSVVVMIF
jgi:hypothetical protein